MINVQENLAEDKKFQKTWKYLAFVCKVKIAIYCAFFGVILWFNLLWEKHQLFASIVPIAIHAALLVRIAFFYPRSKCWLVTYYVIDILKALVFVGLLFNSPEVVEMVKLDFESEFVSLKIYWVAVMVLSLIQVITLVFSLVFCNKLLCCPGYNAQHYLRLNNPSHHIMGEVSPPGYTDQPTMTNPATGYTDYYADSRDHVKLIVTV